jgi:hypothetical protein
MRRLHLSIGLAGIAGFLLTGVLMRLQSPGMAELDDGTRMLFRSRHIYFLLASLVNLGIGIYYQPLGSGYWRWLQFGGSCLILLAPILLIGAFFTEAPRSEMNGHLAAPAIICIFVGTLAHALSGAGRSKA